MRVYEFSKKQGVSSKRLIELLESAGIEVGNHMSVLSPQALTFLEAAFAKKAGFTPKEKIAEKPKNTKKVAMSTSTATSASQSRRRAKPTPTKHKARVMPTEQVAQTPTVITLQPMTVGEIAQKLDQPVADIIMILLRNGIVAAKNQVLSEETVEILAQMHDVPTVKLDTRRKESELQAHEGDGGEKRLPVVAVLGHVDHGKTTLLDFIRKTRVVAREKGGITQHLGAYEAATAHGNIVFIDTPGHAAFSRLRARGIRVADVVILVVAADDSVMPQTIEAIKQAKSMNVPVVVAVSKMDVANPSRVDVIRRDLAQHDLLAEEWGGEVVVVPISAKTGEGIDTLLEVVALQAEMLELRADREAPGHCYALEAQFERGRGAVATILCQRGSVQVGDFFACGDTVGRVSSLVDSSGKRIQKVGPSVPVIVSGFDALAQAGDLFAVISKNEYKSARSSSGKRPLFTSVIKKEGGIRFIVKTDTDSSRGAILDAIEQLSKKNEGVLIVIQSGVGDVSEGDVALAEATGARIVGFNVRLESAAAEVAKKSSVKIDEFDIIYKLLENLEELIQSSKKKEERFVKIGSAQVRHIFNIKGTTIAGAYVQDGKLVKGARVAIMRSNQKIGEGSIKSLQRERKSVNQINAGYECAFVVDGFNEWEKEDIVECFEKRTD